MPRHRQLLKLLVALIFGLVLIGQPLIGVTVQAQTPTSSTAGAATDLSDAQQIAASGNAAASVNDIFNDWSNLDWVTNTITPAAVSGQPQVNNLTGILTLGAQDQSALTTCANPNTESSCNVDSRVTDYLTSLLTPAYLGGQGFTNIQADILQGYTTGIGQYDRTSLAADPNNPSLTSAHTTGQAVDITQVGEVTCKLVEHRKIGGHTTLWQAPTPVKVAWQSPEGFASNPTPTASSLLGVASQLTAQGFANYLNSTGDLDTSVDYLKGMDMNTLAQYVGTNVLLKTLSSSQITSDPLATSVIGALGGSVLTQQLPGLPAGVIAENPTTDIRTALGESQVETGLGLPAGSLSGGFGWQNVLTTVGKRVVEQDLGLPANYLNVNSLTTLNANSAAQAAFGFVNRTDNSLNLATGTVALLQQNNTKGLEMAGINALASALKMSSSQIQTLTSAVASGQTPSFAPGTLATGSQLSVDGLAGLLSTSSSSQQTATNELTSLGLNLIQTAVGQATASQYTGLTQTVLNSLTNPSSTVSLGSIISSLGAHQLLTSTNLDPSQAASLLANPNQTNLTSLIAQSLNSTFNLSGATALSANTISGFFQGNGTPLLQLGASEISKAFGWSNATGLAVVNNQTSLASAMQQSFANGVGALLGLTGNDFSLSNNTSQTYGSAIVDQRLGLTSLSDTSSLPDVGALYSDLGSSQFDQIFGVSSLNQSTWSDPSQLNADWSDIDTRLGLSQGSTQQYLTGQLSGSTYAQTTGNNNLGQISPTQLWNQFNLSGDYQLSGGNTQQQQTDVTTILNYLKGAAGSSSGASQALTLIGQIVGNSVDAGASFTPGTFLQVANATNIQGQVSALLNQGVALFVATMANSGSNTQLSFSTQALAGLASALITSFNNSVSTSTTGSNGAGFTSLNQLFQAGTNIPQQYSSDYQSFITGDYSVGFAGANFMDQADQLNQYLPSTDQLSYGDFDNSLNLTDQSQITSQIATLPPSAGTKDPSADLVNLVRQQLMTQYSQKINYQTSDALLRKTDPTIPVGFTQSMLNGTSQQRAQILQDFAFSSLDSIIKQVDPTYQSGALEQIYEGKLTGQAAINALLGPNNVSVQTLLNAAHINLGPLNAASLGNLVTYFGTPGGQQADLTSAQFAPTWVSLNNWLSGKIGVALPTGLTQSLFLASQNGWNFNKNLTNSAGQVIVPSLNALASNFATAELSGWADKELKLPVGTVYRVYQAAQGVINASQALANAEAAALPGSSLTDTQVTQAQGNLSAAQAGLAVVVIDIALQVIPGVQAFFSSIDQAIGAPAGFTNAVVSAAIASAFGLGPAGFLAAAAIFLFGVSSTSYDCPEPPVDQYAITSFDQGADQLNYGYTPGATVTSTSGTPAAPGGTTTQPTTPSNPSPTTSTLPLAVSSTPLPGESPFTWASDNNIQFVDGNNPQVWEGWARYYVGALLQATINYGAAQNSDSNKPLQVFTYRQANVEYFNPQAVDGFGQREVGNQYVGMGYTQGSTNTVNYVSVSFGGLG